ncbi:MAG: hypothetical protein ACE5L6_07635 [Candidatus Bathyarchaeia archaeon]
MAKEIVVEPYGVFYQNNKSKKGIKEKLKKFLNRRSFWISL